MSTHQEKLDKYVDRSNRIIPNKIDLKRTVVHCLDIQNLCLSKKGSDYVESVGGAPSGEETLVQAKKVLDLAREKSDKNPVYYVQYAYARISSILKKSKGHNLNIKLDLLNHVKKLLCF